MPTPAPTPSKTVEDKNLIESILYLKQNKLLQEPTGTIKFETTKEAEDSKKEDVVAVIKEKTNTTKQNITELQKAGHNLHLETIKLIEIPLKTKIWISTLAKKDLETIFKIIREVNTIIAPLKKQNDEKIAEKERLEKEAMKKESLATNPQPAATPTKQSAPNKPPASITTRHLASSATKQSAKELSKSQQQ